MTLFRTVEPALEPVTLAEAKAQLRLGHDSEDALIAGLIRAARDEVERATGTALIDQSWRLALDAWPRSGRVALTPHPVREILSVTVYGSEGEASLVDPSACRLDPHARPARLWLADRPAPGAALNGIEVDFRAGYGEAGTDVPDILKRAILMLTAHWFEFRGVAGAADQPVGYPPGFDRLVSAYRRARL